MSLVRWKTWHLLSFRRINISRQLSSRLFNHKHVSSYHRIISFFVSAMFLHHTSRMQSSVGLVTSSILADMPTQLVGVLRRCHFRPAHTFVIDVFIDFIFFVYHYLVLRQFSSARQFIKCVHVCLSGCLPIVAYPYFFVWWFRLQSFS